MNPNVKELRIYGAGDDLVELEGFVDDEIDCYDRDVILIIKGESGGCVITMNYGPPGVWGAHVRQLDEEVYIPWPVTITNHPNHRRSGGFGYSVLVTLQLEEGVLVTWTTQQSRLSR